MCLCVLCVCVSVCVCPCVRMFVRVQRGRNWLWWWGEQLFGWRWGTPSWRENSAIPERKLGHKTQQNYNRLNYKMYDKSVIIHKIRIFPNFQNKVKNLHKYNNNDNNRAVPCQIIQYFWMLTPLPLRFCSPLHHPQIMPKWPIPENFNPQPFTVPKPLWPYCSDSRRK